VHQLVEAGCDVTVLDNFYSGNRWALPQAVRLIEGDIGDPKALEQVRALHDAQPFSAALHFAAHIEVGESVENPAKYYANNTVKALGLFNHLLDLGIRRIVFSSTAAVYGDGADELLTERHPVAPVNPYGHSKAMSEQLLKDLCGAKGGQAVILRYFNVAGARLDAKIGQATPRATHLIKIACEVATGQRESLSIFGRDYPTPDGTCLRDYIHVEDLAEAHLLALGSMQPGSSESSKPDAVSRAETATGTPKQVRTYNVGYGRPYSVLEVISAMEKVIGRKLTVRDSARRPGDGVRIAADASLIRDELGWRPRHDDLELICRTALEWERRLLKMKER
jgi:UDP-glucose 4-epimerase